MNKLKELRGKRKITDVATDLNLTAKTYYNYESGTRQPDHDTLCRIADYYAVTVDYLLGRHAQTKEHNEMLLIGAQVRLPIL
jgi:transcriptional regulator with XRE-family HTH domain